MSKTANINLKKVNFIGELASAPFSFVEDTLRARIEDNSQLITHNS